MIKEIWKPIKGYSNYEVSNLGNIKSKARYTKINHNKFMYRNECILKGFINNRGYKQITIKNDKGKSKTMRVHRLVAEAFILNKNNLPQIDHKDGNKLNNCVSNLEWVSNYENHKRAVENNLKFKNFIAKKVNQYDLNGQFIKQWNRIEDACVFYKTEHISACCKGQRKTTAGYIWRYVDTAEVGAYE